MKSNGPSWLARTSGIVLLGSTLALTGATPFWGEHGHVMSGLAAATDLPADMPAFFRDSRERLGYLNYEPDRWRDAQMPEMNEALQYDHFIDLENVPAEALAARDRFTYLAILQRAGLREPQREGGLLPFRILELHERLLVEFRLWRTTTDAETRSWIEQRIIDDAGILGHYVSDGANPHHSTIHYNGWAQGAPNPDDYTTDRTFHGRFESRFVGAKVRLGDIMPHVRPPARIDDVRATDMAHIQTSNSLVPRLYQLEKIEPFGENTQSPQHKTFVVERLAAGVNLLRSLWYTAWLNSAP